MLKLTRKAKDRSKQNRAVLFVFSDTHAGFHLGLLNPETKLYHQMSNGDFREVKIEPNEMQEILWKLYIQYLNDAAEIANGSPIVAIHNGDITHGMRFMSEMETTRMSDQIEIAVSNLKPVMELPNLVALRMTTGTESHEMGEGSSCIEVSRRLSGAYPDIDVSVVKHGLVTIAGAQIDYTHHGPHPGSRYMLRGNIARLHMRDYITEGCMRGLPPPRLFIRSHYHRPVCEDDTTHYQGASYRSTILVTPPMCAPTYHALQATRSTANILYIGANIVEIENGNINIIEKYQELDLRTKEVINV